MLTRFLAYIREEKIFRPSDRILLAVSGGVDSMTMCDLFHRAKFDFAVAHCNFGLRGTDADTDERFVKQAAARYEVPFYVTRFDTESFSKKEKVSVQMAARALRYQWFEEIRDTQGFAYIAVAHHQNDIIETVLINLIKGTGIAGLHGILPRQGYLIRPLLFAQREDVEHFAMKHKIRYREDSSNLSDKYVRNKLRLKVIPILKEINPSLEDTFAHNLRRIKDVEDVYLQFVAQKRKTLVVKKGDTHHIQVSKLRQITPLTTLLFELLRPFNFSDSVASGIARAIQGQGISGKHFFSPTHCLLKDRHFLIITPKEKKTQEEYFITPDQKKLKTGQFQMLLQKKSTKHTLLHKEAHTAFLDYDKLKFPLLLRHWKKGDHFCPLGMEGKKKKLSDFFVDKKFSLHQKENTWVLCSGKNIVWIAGQRIDDRYKLTPGTQHSLVIRFNPLV